MQTISMFGPMVATGVDLTEIDAPPRRVRAILAMLLLEPRRSVLRQRIGDELWGDRPPPSAAGNLRNHLATLRQWLNVRLRLAPQLTTQGEVVSLRLSADVGFDLDEFRTALDAGRNARGVDPHEAERCLDRAIGVRRGRPFQDIPCGPVLSATGVLLDSLWQAAVEEHAGLLLWLGRHEQARERLQFFVAEHPTRERAWTVLMAACQASADTAGGLAAYRAARAALNDELGVEPGAELQAAHRSLLRREPIELPWQPMDAPV
ncbi:AfsR/SARP family transcriptional regulator [Catellatospora citrea]|uniref:Bacterial transcriptional activator domain-containing protein n=1 Tax=Catellatospora citrea TaxID=53366 RepID=A0A8J3NY50_9ACTN|nr:BTAD domain-containing putative transcriptional regulator [Catellatospora citrea]RKE05618.1 DNA-binding SARP family transcriptional activator [Catellatospora citrea]GIF96972.1 hypothetical protein Cci01nite_20660 [Catellatospora citrea]